MTVRSLAIWLVTIVLAAMAVLAGCGDGTPDRDRDGKLYVVATVAMVGDVVQRVAGPDARVETLMGSGVDPHLYRPTRDDVRRLYDADVVFHSGYHLEGRMGEVLHALESRKPSVALAERAAIGVMADESENSHDPHCWMDPSRWKQIAGPMIEALAAARPAQRSAFEERAAAFEAECDALAEYGRRALDGVPAERRVLITSHDAFRYFGEAFGIRVLGLQGLSTESESSLRQINEVAAEVVRLKVPAVFVESSVPAKSVQALIDACASQGHTVRVGGELFSDAMGPPGTYEGTYIGMIDHNLTTVARALGGDAPATGMNGKLTVHP